MDHPSKNFDNNKDFHAFAKLSDVNLNLTFRISSLLGHLPKKSMTDLLDRPEEAYFGAQQSAYPDLYVTVRLYSDNKPLSVPFQTSYKPFKHNHQWSEWITLPYKLCDLPLNSQLAFTVHDVKPSCYEGLESLNAEASDTSIIGGTCFKLFGKKGSLKKAQHRLLLWPGVPGDGSVESSTPAKVAPESQLGSTEDGNNQSGNLDEMGRLGKLIKRHERSDLPSLIWLDKLVYRQIEKINSQETEKSKRIYLYIDMPRFDLPIVFCEQEAGPTIFEAVHGGGGGNSSQINHSVSSKDASGPGTSNLAGGSAYEKSGSLIDGSLFTVVDPEIARDNPVEAKHRRLVRSHRSGPLDRELKPNAAVRDELNEILSYPPTRVLSPSETDRIWSFRFYLTRDPKGLTKFLKSVVWSDSGEAKQATEVLLPMWSEPGLDDALELLGPTFRDPRVRAFAVRLLERADDEELILYLLQLVQALKFDSISSDSSSSSADRPTDRRGTGGTTSFSPSSSVANQNKPLSVGSSPSNSSSLNNGESGLTDFLIRRSLKNPVLGNNLYWYLLVECDDKTYGKMYKKVKARYWEKMGEIPNGAAQRELFTRQATLLSTLSTKAKELRSSKDARPKKIDKLRALIADSKSGLGPGKLDPPLPLPLDARVKVTGIRSDKSTVFKSNLFPLLLHFERTDEGDYGEEGEAEGAVKRMDTIRDFNANSNNSNDSENLSNDPSSSFGANSNSGSDSERERHLPSYSVIFKNGDDLRQDQLVIQLFTLMDRLLRNENLDLKITPYKVLATGSIDGMVQFVPSLSIAAIMNSFGGSLLNYLRHHHPEEGSTQTYGVKPSVLDTFVRSCAGYCVVTYLLGVGDRHLDNLLLSPDGHFFHVDFGYILGRDPKPFPPPVKVCKEMVDGMGGTNSIHYHRFRSLCFTAFTSLRKSANLILNLVALMVDANIPDIKVEPDKAVLKVQEKFRLDLSEDEAIKHFENLLNETSYLSAVFDRLHDVAQYFRQ